MDILNFNAARVLSESFEDPYKNAAFAIVAMYRDDYWGAIAYNHYLQPTGRANYSHSSSYQGMGGTTGNTGTEFFNSGYSWARTDNHSSSSSSSYGGLTSRIGHGGHQSIEVGPQGHMIGRSAQAGSYVNHYSGTWANNDTNKMWAIGRHNGSVWIAPRTPFFFHRGTQVPSCHIAYNSGNMISTGKGFNNTTGYGTIAYNEKAKRLMVKEYVSGSSVIFHTWTLVAPPTGPDFFDKIVASSPHHSWRYAYPSSVSTNSETAYRGTIVIHDDGGFTYMHMEEGSRSYLFQFEENPTQTGAYTQTHTSTYNLTTSYGHSQGTYYGLRHQVTHDGRYIIMYNPYYYYGSGIQLTLVRVTDGRMLTHRDTSSSYGFSFAPILENTFIISRDYNSDGNGIWHTVLDLDTLFHKYQTDGSNISLSFVYGLDTPYHSTDYSYLIPIMGAL